ncbi:MAG: hypoxanthine phosphoribosyltransferase [Candidatus Tectomicrobia bacterium]|uniref:Hypoxanthine phosphoribosyltransferase n=1 Tax=Tectimicrobiota bacterium TaxID=2528274 RepID=A0A932MN04_UNCTE|nr:hypoxanthine phosphoribosyltransferase [Candidatus Tectomicrobia bacterium]
MPLGETLIPEEKIRRRVRELARELDAALPPGPVHCVVVLKSAVFFAADLLRSLKREVSVGFLSASSYGDATESAGEVRVGAEALGPVEGRHVLLIDDILDTGHTMAAVRRAILARRPASLRSCVLLDKPSRRRVDARADHVGFTIADVFVVGYGLDFAEEFRTLPDIRAYQPGESSK